MEVLDVLYMIRWTTQSIVQFDFISHQFIQLCWYSPIIKVIIFKKVLKLLSCLADHDIRAWVFLPHVGKCFRVSQNGSLACRNSSASLILHALRNYIVGKSSEERINTWKNLEIWHLFINWNCSRPEQGANVEYVTLKLFHMP
jgi:hypothetical protein